MEILILALILLRNAGLWIGNINSNRRQLNNICHGFRLKAKIDFKQWPLVLISVLGGTLYNVDISEICAESKPKCLYGSC